MAFEHFDQIAALKEGAIVQATDTIKNKYGDGAPDILAGTPLRIDFVCHRGDAFYAKADFGGGMTIKARVECCEFHKIEICAPEVEATA